MMSEEKEHSGISTSDGYPIKEIDLCDPIDVSQRKDSYQSTLRRKDSISSEFDKIFTDDSDEGNYQSDAVVGLEEANYFSLEVKNGHLFNFWGNE